MIAGGAGILFTGHNWIDPVLSFVIAALILWTSIGIVRETLNILLEGTPRGVSLSEIRSGMEDVEGVATCTISMSGASAPTATHSPAMSASPTFHPLRVLVFW